MLRYVFLLGVWLPMVSVAADPFDGVWRTRPESVKRFGRPDVYVLAKGAFRCAACFPMLSVTANGSDQAVKGHVYYDTVAVRELSPLSIEVLEKLNGQPSGKVTLAVSPDGGTLTLSFKDFTGPRVADGSMTERRVGPAAFPGTHAISGSWRPADAELTDLSPAALLPDRSSLRLESTAGGLTASWNHCTFSAPFDGKPYPIAGDPGDATVALAKTAPNIIEETIARQGRFWGLVRLTLSSDGATVLVEQRALTQIGATYVLEHQ